MQPTVRAIRDGELEAWFGAFSTSFYIWAVDPAASAAARGPQMDLQRTLGAFDDATIVGTFRSFATALTLPGGARVPASAVTAVSVRPTHRRRGILSSMIARDLEASVERGDAVSILIASEWPIYGRFGYGPATQQGRWTIRVRDARFLVEPVGSIEVVGAPAALPILLELYGRVAAAQPGEIDRQASRWEFDLGLAELPGRTRWQGSVAIHRDDHGVADGFARIHGEEHWPEGIPDNVLIVDELRGVTNAAEIDLWRHLAQMDLTATITAERRRPAEAFPWYLEDARAARLTGVQDMLWLRIVDLPRVLGERRYERDGELVLEVADRAGGADGPAAGRYRLVVSDGGASCERTRARPDLTIDVRALGAALLGGTRLVDATRTLPWSERRVGALRDADALLATAAPPWCATFF